MLTLASRTAFAVLLAAACVLPTTRALSATGGPDGGGYYFEDSDEPGVTYSWVDISKTGTLSTAGDFTSEDVVLPFSFEWYGTAYTDVTIDGDGVLAFGAKQGVTGGPSSCIPYDAFTDNALIAALWDDLDPDDKFAGGIYYETLGKSPNRMFVVSWIDVPVWWGYLYFDFQIILYEGTNEVLVQYADVSDPKETEAYGADALVGIQRDETVGLSYSCFTASLADDLAILYYRSTCEDADKDKYTTCDNDCDDNNAAINPGATEADDDVDNDCDGLVDEDFVAVGDLIVTEFLPVGLAVKGDDAQYVEIHNTSVRDVDLIGWELMDDGSDAITIDESVIVTAGGYALLVANDDAKANGGLPAADWAWDALDFSLASTSDEIVLSMDGTEIDVVEYDLAVWPWADGQSTYLDPGFLDEVENDDPYHWCITPQDKAYDYGLAPGDWGTPQAANPAKLCCTDADKDGFSTCEGDCDDSSAAAYPGADEICDGIDNDCDGGVDEGLLSYSVRDSNDKTGPAYSWIDISTTGTNTKMSDGDEVNVTLPFAFEFYGVSYTDISIDEDGVILFGADEAATFTNPCIPGNNTLGGDALIAGLWDDLDAGGGAVYYETQGTAPNQMFIASWVSVPRYGSKTAYTFEIILYETTNEIVVQYMTVGGKDQYANGGSAAVGVQLDETTGTSYSCNDAKVLHDDLAVLFYDGSTVDEDGDGFTPCDGDCDDTSADAFPGWLEVCDGIDNDCDGEVDENALGYDFLDSDDVGGPTYGFVDISKTGIDTLVTDDGEFTVALPFAFDFYGAPVTDITIAGNGGLLMAGGDELGTSNQCIPGSNSSGGEALVAALWDDLNAADKIAGGVYYETQGTAPNQTFIVQYDDVPHYGQDDLFTFEVVLTEGSNDILVQYETVSGKNTAYNNGMSATAGVQLSDTVGTEYSCNTDQILHDGLAVLYRDLSSADGDGDGYSVCDGDCDDTDATVNPGMPELCDKIDNDCIAATDENVDFDGDGYSACDGDCNDLDAGVNQDAKEDCGDGIDNDCDGDIDGADDECASDDDTGDDDTGDDDTGDDDTGDDDDDTSDDDTGDDDTDDGDDDTDGSQDCTCRQDGSGATAAPLALAALLGLVALRRLRI